MVNSNEASLPLATPDSFSFPYELPYEIQTILMRVSMKKPFRCLFRKGEITLHLLTTSRPQHVYSAIEDRCAAVVESPTGTVSQLLLFGCQPLHVTESACSTALPGQIPYSAVLILDLVAR